MAVSGKARRYLVFYGSAATAEIIGGGWADYFRGFDDLHNAKKEVKRLRRDYPHEVEWWHVVDLNISQIILAHDDPEN